MARRVTRAVVGMAAVGLVVGMTAVPVGASAAGAPQGVTKDAIEIVVISPDIDSVKARGINVGNLSTADFTKRISTLADAYGPINGRTINFTTAGWDPLDITSYSKTCTKATQDNKPFLVINGTGYLNSQISCITVDNDTPFITGDNADKTLQKASGKNLVTGSLPPEVTAAGAVDLVAQTKAFPKTAKIGIISNNLAEIKAAGDTLEAEFTKKGYDVVEKVELNGLSSDAQLQTREAQAAVPTFTAQGIDTVFNLNPGAQMAGFHEEATRSNYKPKYFYVDGRGALVCTPTAPSLMPATAMGSTCITFWDQKTTPGKDKVDPDNALEARCRKEFEAGTGTKTLPGSGLSSARTVGGVEYQGDLSAPECTIASYLLPAIKKAGKNLTWDKVYANLMATTKGSSAYMSDGEGGFGKNKPYWAAQKMHFMVATPADATTPKDANGLFNGCPAPVNCWVPVLVNDKEWFDVG